MDEKLGKFIDDFAALVQLAQSGNHREQAGKQLLQALTEHLGTPASDLSVVVEEIPPHRFVDADIVMAQLVEQDPGGRLVGRKPPPRSWRSSACGWTATVSSRDRSSPS